MGRAWLTDSATAYAFCDPVPCLPRPERAADVLCSFFLTNGSEDGGFDFRRFRGHPQMSEHHCRGQDCAEWIRHVLAGDRWGRAVDGFEHRGFAGMDVAAGGHAQAALQGGGEVGDDVAEHVVGDDEVKLAWIAD